MEPGFPGRVLCSLLAVGCRVGPLWGAAPLHRRPLCCKGVKRLGAGSEGWQWEGRPQQRIGAHPGQVLMTLGLEGWCRVGWRAQSELCGLLAPTRVGPLRRLVTAQPLPQQLGPSLHIHKDGGTKLAGMWSNACDGSVLLQPSAHQGFELQRFASLLECSLPQIQFS